MVCGALAALLSLEEDMEIVAEASRGDEVIPTALDALPPPSTPCRMWRCWTSRCLAATA
jgi:hypothetical protein